MGEEIKVNAGISKVYTSGILRACNKITSNIGKSPSPGSTNYSAYVTACNYASDIGDNVNSFIDKVNKDCKNVSEIAEKFREHDREIAGELTIGRNRRRKMSLGK